jgi:hypothetical protein
MILHHVLFAIRHLSSVICFLPSAICHLLFAIRHLSSAFCHLPSAPFFASGRTGKPA